MVLQSIRERLNGIIALFVIGLLIIPFAFVGVSSYFTSDAQNAVALVNDQEITLNQFNQGFQNYRRRMQARMGSAFDPELFDQAIIRRQFLDQLINEELLSQVAEDAGLTVTDERLAQQIRSYGAFEVDGEFNVDVYTQRLAAQGTTPQQFEADVRSSLVFDQFPSAIANSAIATQWELNDYARLQDQQRAFSAVVVPAVANPDDIIEDEALVAWYEANQGDFMSEEQVLIEYLELEASTLGGAVEVDEEYLKARFEEQQARFITPEARLASHILIEVDANAPQVDIDAAENLASELSERVRAGEDFAALAQEFSQDLGSASEGGDLGWIEPGYMVQSFEDGLYELSMQSPVSDPVQSRFGWHVIQLREIRPSEGMSYTEARDVLLAEYQAEEDEKRFIEQADRLIDIIYEDPTTLDAAANELGLEVKTAGPFGRQGGFDGVAANPEVVKAAFSDLVLAQGSVSDPVDLAPNHMVLVRVAEHMPEALKPMDEVRGQLIAAVQSQRAMEAAQARAEAILERVSAGEGLAAVAVEQALEVVSAEAATRNATDIDASLRDQVFLVPVPAEGPVREIVEVSEGFAVIQLEGVTDGVIAEDDPMRKQAYSRRIAAASATDEAMGFLQMLRAQSTIEVYEDRL